VKDDEELLRRTDKDPEAFGRFYARHERAVLSFEHCYRQDECRESRDRATNRRLENKRPNEGDQDKRKAK